MWGSHCRIRLAIEQKDTLTLKLQGDDDILHGVAEYFHMVGGDIVCRAPLAVNLWVLAEGNF